jgi:hypothetical protein
LSKAFRRRNPVITIKINVDLFECQQDWNYFR